MAGKLHRPPKMGKQIVSLLQNFWCTCTCVCVRVRTCPLCVYPVCKCSVCILCTCALCTCALYAHTSFVCDALCVSMCVHNPCLCAQTSFVCVYACTHTLCLLISLASAGQGAFSTPTEPGNKQALTDCMGSQVLPEPLAAHPGGTDCRASAAWTLPAPCPPLSPLAPAPCAAYTRVCTGLCP